MREGESEEARKLQTNRVDPSTHPPIHSSTHPPIHPSTPYIRFAIQDQGRGIPADKLESIFGRFQQVDSSDSREKSGTGLGLAICKSIVQQHGGQIWVESELNRGSIFYFTLPLFEPELNHFV